MNVSAKSFIERDGSAEFEMEVAAGERFLFGANWSKFLRLVDRSRIALAQSSLQAMLETESLEGKRFLDIGSGSGLFSLAAWNLGAEVHSFDFDPQSVACTRELQRRYMRGPRPWTIDHASVLDGEYLQGLGSFDVVYSWGVLHHTGSMWQAMKNAGALVAPGGKLFIAIYDDQGSTSRRWKAIKKRYCSSSSLTRGLLLAGTFLYFWVPVLLVDLLKGRPFRSWTRYGENCARGMSAWRDLVDWVGGYPFEVATPGEVIDFYRRRGFVLERLKTARGGCNEFVFSRLYT